MSVLQVKLLLDMIRIEKGLFDLDSGYKLLLFQGISMLTVMFVMF
jgi:hypothetical protein